MFNVFLQNQKVRSNSELLNLLPLNIIGVKIRKQKPASFSHQKKLFNVFFLQQYLRNRYRAQESKEK
jgi:hypothetical protein